MLGADIIRGARKGIGWVTPLEKVFHCASQPNLTLTNHNMSEPYLPPEDRGAEETESTAFFVRIGKLFVAGACWFEVLFGLEVGGIQSALQVV